MTIRKRIAVIGTGVSGLAAAWLLNQRHDITVFEKASWVGGHCNTVDVDVQDGPFARKIAVDTGFIVFNERTYPNLTALFEHLGVPTTPSQMSFSASVSEGRFEYSGNNFASLIAQKRNLIRPRFWNMVLDILRFYRDAAADARRPENASVTLGEYLTRENYSDAFLRDHLLPMGSSIWSASLQDMRGFPLAAFVRFFANHGLMEVRDSRRPKWLTVTGGSRVYVERMSEAFAHRIHKNCGVAAIRRGNGRVELRLENGETATFDEVVIATHSDQALRMLADASDTERRLLGKIRYEQNFAVLHNDPTFMPKRKRAWASWNYTAPPDESETRLVCVTYWMNLLQSLDARFPLFLTLNPHRAPAPGTEIAKFEYDHPIFDMAALDAQQELWDLQGQRRTWFCGAYFGHGFHEDGLQAGLAVGEALGGLRRPWTVAHESGRIHLRPALEVAA